MTIIYVCIWNRSLKIQNDQNKSVTKECPTHFDHCRDLFRGELSKNEVIFQNIHLRAETCGDLCRVFDKTAAQR